MPWRCEKLENLREFAHVSSFELADFSLAFRCEFEKLLTILHSHPPTHGDSDMAEDIAKPESKKMVAGILAILLGSLGIHKFYLGYTTPGIIQLALGFCFGIGGVIGIIEGIMYLTKSDSDFVNTYQIGKKPWF